MRGTRLGKNIAYFSIIFGIILFLDYFGYINFCTLCDRVPVYGLAMGSQALGGGLLALFLLKRWFPKGDLRLWDDDE